MTEAEPWLDDEPTLSEEGGVRYLHFGTEWVQGAMRVSRPAELVLAYTQQMMAWLLFLEPSRRDHVGILGLGAGSLLRYTLKYTSASVRTAEWNPAVTAICRAYFRLPETPRSVIDHCDAALWVQEPGNFGRYMALMVDLYDASAQGPVRDTVAFYEGCHRALADAGVMTVNLFGDHASFPRNLDNIRAAFGGRVLELPEIDAGNRIVLAFKGPVLDITAGQLLERAELVEAEYGLPARRWAKALLAGQGWRGSLAV
ncbi:MAG: spermidine synthase [Alcaligenaceae bacterium]|nr:spermidine synthase [Alcaligenaceae bacterium]